MNGSTRVVDYLPIKEAAKFLTARTGRKFKKLDIFQEARNGHIALSAELLSAAKCNHGRVEALISMPGHKITHGEAPHSQRISGVLDLFVESGQIFEIADGELQIGRDDRGNALPEGLHFKTTRLYRVVELLNDDGTKAKKLPKDARWVVRRSSLERYLNPDAAPGENETLQSRVQAYRSLEWLTLEQAADWIEIISSSAVEDSYLYAMAEFGNCSMYVDASGLKGQTEVKYRPSPLQPVRGIGICEVVTPLVAEGRDTHLYGPVEFIGGYDDGKQKASCSWWISPNIDYEPLFKSNEIEEIGKMTTASGWSSQTPAIAGAPKVVTSVDEVTTEALNIQASAAGEIADTHSPIAASEPARLTDHANSSDAALGAAVRQQRKDFAGIPRDDRLDREREYQRWRDTAAAIQDGRDRKASQRALAGLVKDQLRLPDSVETIRKRL